MKSPAMLPPRKDPIPDQDITIIITQQDPFLPPLLAKWPTGYKPCFNGTYFSNKIEEEENKYTDNSRTENEYCVNKLNVKRMDISIMNTKKIIQYFLKVVKM